MAQAVMRCAAGPVFVPLPYGTANLIARDLQFPINPRKALLRSLRAPNRLIDYAEIGGQPLLHSAVFGTFAEIAEARELYRSAPTFEDRIGAASEWFDRLISSEPKYYAVTIDGQTAEFQTNAIFVTNNPITHGDAGTPRRSHLDRGTLSVYISDSRGPFGFLQRIIEAVSGTFDESHGIAEYTAREVEVRCLDDEAHLTVDGEPRVTEETIKMAIHPSCLRVPDLRGFDPDDDFEE
jgi:diacylglycerol kinase family enzyme